MIPLLGLLQVADPQLPPTSTTAFLIATVVKMLLVFTVYMVGVALLTLAERKISAWIQDRHGPNRVGPWGLLQPAADGLKNIMKEETYPAAANKPIFILAPVLAFIPAMLAWAVIPFGAPLPTRWGLIDLVVADLPIGFLFVLAFTSLGVYGIVLAGWASNNKYSLLGGLRSSAQMVSYEIAMGMSLIPVLLLAGNVHLNTIVQQQAVGYGINWNILTLSLAFLLFMISAFAETNRLPFDLPEAESELIGGYHTEYSAMKFSLFFIAEYANMVTASGLMATLFLGGWDIPFTLWDNTPPWFWAKTLLTFFAFALKTAFFVFFFMWIRWTLPRFRYDQLMALGWKVMLPLSLVYIVLIAVALLVLQSVGIARGTLVHGGIMLAINVIVLLVLFFVADRGRVISPASRRVPEEELERMRARSRREILPQAGD